MEAAAHMEYIGTGKIQVTCSSLFHKSVGAFLVHDVTNKDLFLALESWKEKLNNTNYTKILVILVGNKVDLPNKQVTSEDG